MSNVWSFNTTVRNPERLEQMLRALEELEGVDFDEDGQKAFFGLQIKKRLYKPSIKKLLEADLIAVVHNDDSGEDIDDELVDRILAKYDGSVNAAGRGRTAAGVLNRFGLCIALQSHGPVVITDLAKKWLDHKIDDYALFTKFLLKWQYPNPIESGYSDFDIKPFVGTLTLLREINKRWEELGENPVGLSKIEYQLFVPSLIKHDQIADLVDEIVEFRRTVRSKTGVAKKDYINEYSKHRVEEVMGSSKKLKKDLNNWKDYTDSSIRYFRMSGLIALRGKDTHVDFAEDKCVEINAILDAISGKAEEYKDDEAYFNYLSNEHSLELPWNNSKDLKKIIEQLQGSISQEAGEEVDNALIESIKKLDQSKGVEVLENELNSIRINKLKLLKHDLSALDDSIERLMALGQKNYSPLTARPSLDFEWYVSRALMVLNDSKNILPSYKVGDDGIPTGFRANVPDIECLYESFGMTVEVTLLAGRDQWYAEGQPVMQHHRDFENKIEVNEAYCLFVAPYIHRGTMNTFWDSNTSLGGYEGENQKIIPITLDQFIIILKEAREMIDRGCFTHKTLGSLLELFSSKTGNVTSSIEWLESFPSLISQWAGQY
jgi:hypothetical protein